MFLWKLLSICVSRKLTLQNSNYKFFSPAWAAPEIFAFLSALPGLLGVLPMHLWLEDQLQTGKGFIHKTGTLSFLFPFYDIPPRFHAAVLTWNSNMWFSMQCSAGLSLWAWVDPHSRVETAFRSKAIKKWETHQLPFPFFLSITPLQYLLSPWCFPTPLGSSFLWFALSLYVLSPSVTQIRAIQTVPKVELFHSFYKSSVTHLSSFCSRAYWGAMFCSSPLLRPWALLPSV